MAESHWQENVGSGKRQKMIDSPDNSYDCKNRDGLLVTTSEIYDVNRLLQMDIFASWYVGITIRRLFSFSTLMFFFSRLFRLAFELIFDRVTLDDCVGPPSPSRG